MLLCICDSRSGYMTEFWTAGEKEKANEQRQAFDIKEAVVHDKKKNISF